jgi:outer membrane protein insertion porin family
VGASLLGTWAGPAGAQRAAERPTYVQGLRIVGNRQVTPEKITRVLRLAPGERYEVEEVRSALKRLFETRQFEDIVAHRLRGTHPDSVLIEIRVSEYPKVDDVRLEGADHVNEDDITKVISVTKGGFVRPALVGSDREAIVDLYREKGYYRAAVHDTIVDDAETRSRVLVYNIDAGEKVSVKHVDFIGVHALETGEVRGTMETNEDRWWRGADFKPKEFEDDRERIIGLYRSYGFLDAQIVDTELDFWDDGRGLDIFVTVDEGQQYFVGDISWTGNELFPDSAIAREITLERGDPVNEFELTFVQQSVGNKFWDRGYIYSTVTPVKSVRGDTVDINIEIAQGSLAHVNEINITGNSKTAENVIRRELVIAPGDVFAASRLRRSLREVFNLGFFAGPPQPSFVPSNEEGDIDLTLRVEEKPAGQFRMGAGFSQLNRISGFIGVTEPNFLGRGLRIGLDWEFSRYRQNVNVQFTEPWLMGTPTELSLSVYSMVQNQVRQQFFSDRRTGFSIRVGRPFPWMDYTTVSARYSLENVELSDFSEGYFGPLRFQTWPQMTSSVMLTFARNSTDNPFHPTLGTRTVVSGRWTGGALGGDVRFQRYEAAFSWYERLLWQFVLELRVSAGVLDGYGDPSSVPDYELFRLGGNRRYALRGYDFYEVVPAGNPLYIGGRYMQIFSYEISFPVAPPTVYGLFFFDAGNTWNSFQAADLADMRRGAGVGIRIELPMLGTVGMDYGYGFDRRFGGAWEPHITFGGAF